MNTNSIQANQSSILVEEPDNEVMKSINKKMNQFFTPVKSTNTSYHMENNQQSTTNSSPLNTSDIQCQRSKSEPHSSPNSFNYSTSTDLDPEWVDGMNGIYSIFVFIQ